MEDSITMYARKVYAMRQAQKEYFKARRMGLQAVSDKWLKESKEAEREVDKMTAGLLENTKPGTLFS